MYSIQLWIHHTPPRLPWCSALFLHKKLLSIRLQRDTSMSIRLPSPLTFMWRLFRWQRKWLNAWKNLSSSAVEGLAMNSFQTYTSCCVFQGRYKLHQRNVSDGIAHCADLKSTWQRPWLKSKSLLHLLWWTLNYAANWPESNNRHPCTEASKMSPSC